ncbi:52 kDa repressor of the inhibitor of the protein kinase-like [Condylostylus longicornis]|uniref:52 kDa repressor of the inhibitor of the protein kinase-like n=1 Tax=Condylostylus longicornis TaxID=2530218 RepID=UPI00244DF18C|nr:52 kDa repressor of the inhibitor of the protein kinase-like [Condylostylus longicornis]
MGKCKVKNCKNYEGKKTEKQIKFFKLPKDEILRAKWLTACGLNKQCSMNTVKVCSDHFVESDYCLKDVLLNTTTKKKHLKKEAVPSQNIPDIYEYMDNKTNRRSKKERQNLIKKVLKYHEGFIDSEFEAMEVINDNAANVASPTTWNLENAKDREILKLKRKLKNAQSKIKMLKKIVSR